MGLGGEGGLGDEGGLGNDDFFNINDENTNINQTKSKL